jgi:hypothetical protein
MKFLRKVLWYSFLSIPVIALLLVLFWKQSVIFLLHGLPFMGETFSKAKWENAVKCSSKAECLEMEMSCIRGPMYRDLKRKHLTSGKDRESVTRLLGPAQVDRKNPSCLVYELGMCSGFKIDYDWLYICFDPNDQIESVSHYQG